MPQDGDSGDTKISMAKANRKVRIFSFLLDGNYSILWDQYIDFDRTSGTVKW